MPIALLVYLGVSERKKSQILSTPITCHNLHLLCPLESMGLKGFHWIQVPVCENGPQVIVTTTGF